MVDLQGDNSHNVVRLERYTTVRRSDLPNAERTLKSAMDLAHGISRSETFTVLKVSGAIFASLVASAMLTVLVRSL